MRTYDNQLLLRLVAERRIISRVTPGSHPPGVPSRVEHWRARLRVRGQFQDFRHGPQSGSHSHVSSRPP